MAQAILQGGTRLAYVVVPLEGEVIRIRTQWTKKEGLKQIEKHEPAGFMVYFPRGHSLRIADEERLSFFRLNKRPRLINLQGLSDPNSPLGQMLSAQDDKSRVASWKKLEHQVIQLATAKSGKNVFTRDATAIDEEVDAFDHTNKEAA